MKAVLTRAEHLIAKALENYLFKSFSKPIELSNKVSSRRNCCQEKSHFMKIILSVNKSVYMQNFLVN